MIQVEQLTKRYAGGKPAVDSISFDVAKGEIVGFLGPNGAGKTTTLRMLTGYLPPTSGSAKVAGFDIFHESLQARAKIGYMPEDVPLYNDMRVKEYLHFRSRLKGLKGRNVRVRTGKVMETCGLIDVRKKMIGNLSKGYRQRVGLADALVHEPDLVILDEPTNGLDPNQIRQVRETIRELKKRHTVLLSTHILPEVEATCDRVIIINEGVIRASDTPAKLSQTIRTAGTVRAEIRADVDQINKAMGRIGGVRKATARALGDGWSLAKLVVESGRDVREEISAVVNEKGWPLRELTMKSATLEDAFVELTGSDLP